MTDQIYHSHVGRAQRFLAMQRKRSLFFANEGIFGDPAWELLLEIYIATEQHQCVAKSSLLADVPTTSTIASRLFAVFMDQGYITHCEGHNADCICMTDNARAECVAYLDAVEGL